MEPPREFSSGQLKCLERSFRVYDPETKKCHSNFGELLGRKVIFHVDMHHSGTLIERQNEWFKHFVTPRDCLFLEGAHPMRTVPPSCCTGWSALPSDVQIIGSDIRVLKNDETKQNAFRKKVQKFSLFRKDKYAQLCKIAHSFANLIKREFQADRARINKYNNLEVSKEVLNLLDQFWDKVDTIKNEVVKAEEKILTEVEPVTIAESNRKLAEYIIEKGKDPTINKIIAIWGSGHLCIDTQLYRSLKEANITFAVLLPNQTLFDEIQAERYENWELILEVEEENPRDDISTKFHLPRCMVPFFIPEVQAIIESSDITVTPEWISEIEQSEEASLEYKNEVTFCFTDFYLTEGLLDRYHQPSESKKVLFELLKLFYVRIGKWLSFRNVDNYGLISQANGAYTLKLLTSDPIVTVVSPNENFPKHLLQRD